MSSVADLPAFRLPSSPTTAAATYDLPEPAPPPAKKDRKWSIGNLFRRGRKKDESGAGSSDCDEDAMRKKGRKKEKRKRAGGKKAATLSGGGVFDHIVMRNGVLCRNRSFDDAAVLSDPSCYFATSDMARGRTQVRPPPPPPESLDGGNHLEQPYRWHGSGDSLRHRKERTKARAVARRDSMRTQEGSSSEGENDSSSSRFRSDDSLTRLPRDGSGSRRSRASRTERYIRRLSKDDESILNREAMQRQARDNWQMKVASPLCGHRLAMMPPPSSQDGFVNPPTHFSGLFTIPPSHSSLSRSRTATSHSHLNAASEVSRAHAQHSSCFNLRSFSCDSDAHKSPSPEAMCTNAGRDQRYRNLSVVEQPYLARGRHPPPPPPRDPRRLTHIQPMDTPANSYWIPVHNPSADNCRRRSQFAGHRTVSEDVIPTFMDAALMDARPASVTQAAVVRPNEDSEQFQYLAEKRARSRKPIVIQSADRISTRNQRTQTQPPKTCPATSRTAPQIFTAKTRVQTKIFLPATIPANQPGESIDMVDGAPGARQNSPFKPISSPAVSEEQQGKSEDADEEMQRKSANLEEALDELEAIYRSLHLGDEDLLERAEQRELSIAAQKMLDAHNEAFPRIARGAISDSGFSYEPFDATHKKGLKKAHTLDRHGDDMAYRKMQSSRASRASTLTSGAQQMGSYLLSSPLQFESSSSPAEHTPVDEPDVTLDDVVYRIVRQANNRLRVPDPQPLFGIPLGPVAPAANSDYLHAVPDAAESTPDIVKDDLAYRNLRKDANKEPALQPMDQPGKERKRRVVRSLSANISTLIDRERNGEAAAQKSHLRDIADTMATARRALKEKDNRVQATKRAFLSDSEAKCAITESQLTFLNSMRSSAGPEAPETSEAASFEELLTALAMEARATSERITNDLRALDDTLKRNDLQRKLARDEDQEGEVERTLTPFEEHRNALVASFQEIKCSEEQTGGEPECVLPASLAYVTEVNLSERLRKQEEDEEKEETPAASYTSNCDLFIDEYRLDELDDDNDSQPSSGFHSNLSDGGQMPSAFERLESPRLVTHAMRATSCGEDGRHDGDPGGARMKTRTWYGDPVVLAFACSYGIACTVQIATMDVVAILGIIFVVISIAAALLLE